MKIRSYALAACLTAAVPLATTGCGETFAQIVTDITNALGPVLTAVNTFLDIAKTLWPTLLPLLPAADQATADAKFTAAVTGLQHAAQAAEDAEAAFQAGTAPQPDVTALIAALQSGVADVDAVVASVEAVISSAPKKPGASSDDLHKLAAGIKAYKAVHK